MQIMDEIERLKVELAEERAARKCAEKSLHTATSANSDAQSLDASIHQHKRELEALQQISRSLAQTLDLQSTLETILRLAVESIPATRACLYLYDAYSQTLRTEALLPADGPIYHRTYALLPMQEQRGLVWWAFAHRKPVHVDNTQTDTTWREIYVPMASVMLSELDVPLIDDDQAIGVLNFESTHEAAFSQEDEAFLVTLASLAVLAIKNAQAYEREKRLADERQALLDINREITSQLDPARVFDLILTKALEVTRSNVGTLHRFDPERHDLYIVAERGVLASQKSRRIKLGEGIQGLAAADRTLLNVADVTALPWRNIHIPDIPSSRSELVVPLIEGDTLRGVLNIEHPEPGHFGPSDARLLLALADQAMIAIQNAERYQRAEERGRRLEAINRVNQETIRQLGDPEQVIRTILESALRLTSGDSADLDLYTDSDLRVTYFAATAENGGTMVTTISAEEPAARSIIRGIVPHVAATRQPYRTGNAQDALHYAGAADIHSEIAVPLLAGTELFGVLKLESRQPDAFSGDDEEMLLLLANQAVIAIESARQYVRAEQEKVAAVQAQQRVREAEAMSSVGQSAASLAHRLGSDLELMPSTLNRVKRTLMALNAADPAVADMNTMLGDVQKVLTLVKDLKRDLSTLEEEQGISRALASLPVRALIEQTISAYPHRPAHVQVHLDLDDDVAMIQVVPREAADILRNLYVNAIETMPKGGTITLRAHNAGNDVMIEVEDTGVGISAERQARIFDLFYSTKGRSGFGLWSARRNALANGGELYVQSQPGQGTTFTLTLPQAHGVDGAAPAQMVRVGQSQRADASETLVRLTELETVIDELRQTDRRRAEVLSMIAHEIRQPLANADMAVHNLLLGIYGKVSEDHLKPLYVAQRAIRTIHTYVEKLLARHRIETGNINLELSLIDIEQIIQRAIELYSYYAERSHISVHYACDPGLSIWADSVLLLQIVGNLVENAIKFQAKAEQYDSERSGGTVTVTAVRASDMVRITIEDSGIGIAEDQLQRILEWGYQVDSSLTRNTGGFGYGLPMIKAYIERHGGRLSVSSTLNRGSIFTVVLPARAAPMPEETA